MEYPTSHLTYFLGVHTSLKVSVYQENTSDKCGFPLAEERKKQKTFFSHGWESGYRCAGDFRSRGLCKVSVLVLLSAIA